MKTDRFSDSIRRKLESIRPDFSESDWSRMQASLRQAAPPPSGSPTAYQPFTVSRGRPWLMAAVAVSFVALVSFAAWQRAQIVTLRQTVSQLSQQQAIRLRQPLPEKTNNAIVPTPDQPTARRGEPLSRSVNQFANHSDTSDRRPDTVYITRYITRPQSTNSAPEGMAQRSNETNEAGEPAIDRATPMDRTSSRSNALPRQRGSDSSATGRPTDVAGAGNGAVSDKSTISGVAQKTSSQPTDRLGADAGTNRQNRPSSASVTNDRTITTNNTTISDAPMSGEVSGADETPRTLQPIDADLLVTRALSMAIVNWNEALARQARRMRPARTTTVGGTAAPVSQPVNPVAFGFRIGAGGELSRTIQSGGLLTELLIGKRLTLGVGVGMASFAGGSFTTDVEFDRKRPKKFRREYARNIHPLSDIVNIGTRTTRLQIPVTVGYRIPIGRTLSLLPSVGTTLGLRSRELVTFTFRQPLRSFESASGRIAQPVDLLNNLTLGAALEWKRNRWVWQAGPLLTIPTAADANWQEAASIGLRMRLFYQF